MIPKHFNFIYLYGPETYPFSLSHYISLKSNIIVNELGKDSVTIWTDDIEKLISSSYFKKILTEFPDRIIIKDVKTEVPFELKSFMGRDIRYATHQADILRNWILVNYGGVYSDFDSVALRPLPKFFYENNKTIMCTEDVDGKPSALCIGFFLGVAGCPLLTATLDRYVDYDPDIVKPGSSDWARFGVTEPFNIYQNHKDWITTIPAEYFEPLYIDYDSVQNEFFLDRSDLIVNSYQLHLWETRNGLILRTMKEDAIKTINSTYTLIARKYL